MGEARRRQTAERQPQYCDLTTGELRPARDGGDPEVYLDSMVQGQQPPVPCNGCTTCCYHTRVDVYLDQERPEDLPHLDTETFFGEKTSLEDVLAPLAIEFNADLYLTGGQISDTLLHGMARDAVADGRPLVVLTFSDFDPAGYWDMPTCIGRKLQALRDLLFPNSNSPSCTRRSVPNKCVISTCRHRR